MSRRWAVYAAAEIKRAEDQKVRDAELVRVLASQARKLSKGNSDGSDEIPGEQRQHGGDDTPAAHTPKKRSPKVQPVPRANSRSQRARVVG